MPTRAHLALGLGVVSLAMGCSAIAGLGGDYTTATGSDAGEDGHVGDASETTDTSVDARPADAGSPPEAATEAGACPTDCASPLPTGAGWSLVAYNPSNADACPAAYSGTTETLLSVSGDPLTCQCSCTLGSLSTCGGMFQLSAGASCTAAGGGDPSYAIPPTANSGRFDAVTSPCQQRNISFQGPGTDYEYALAPAEATAGTCTGASTATNTPAPVLSQGEACGVAANYACACPPAAPPGWSRCAMSASPSAACPSGLTTHILNEGGSVDDARMCGGCASCAVPAPQCADDDAELNFYTDTACQDGQVTFSDTCNFPSTVNTASYTVSFSMNPASCTAGTDPSASGSVTLSGGSAVTLCCE